MAEEDARFEDADVPPLRLRAETVEDLAVLAAAAQDAVGTLADVALLARKREFAFVINRFRWEARDASGALAERVRCGVTVSNVMAARGSGIDQGERDRVFSLLDMAFEAGEDGTGVLRLLMAGGAEIALEVEALDVTLTDISRPWPASSVPDHGQ
jgi:hypothetical protein